MPLPLFRGQYLVQGLCIFCIFEILHVKILSVCIPGNEMRVVGGLLIFFHKGTRWLGVQPQCPISSKQSRRLRVKERAQRSARWRKPSRWSCGMEPLQVQIRERKRGQGAEETLAPLPGSHSDLTHLWLQMLTHPLAGHTLCLSLCVVFPNEGCCPQEIGCSNPSGTVTH